MVIDDGIAIASFIPGRLRLKIIKLKGNQGLARNLEEKLVAIRGIERTETNILTGSLLIHYKPKELSHPESRQAISQTLTAFFPEIDKARVAHWLNKL